MKYYQTVKNVICMINMVWKESKMEAEELVVVWVIYSLCLEWEVKEVKEDLKKHKKEKQH